MPEAFLEVKLVQKSLYLPPSVRFVAYLEVPLCTQEQHEAMLIF
ncbi:hypothetical protein GGD66_002398 [Bradyrhizobium sp. CIR48]|nr:hypothetical protein [Bradyrhizobium sp. CIR48]